MGLIRLVVLPSMAISLSWLLDLNLLKWLARLQGAPLRTQFRWAGELTPDTGGLRHLAYSSHPTNGRRSLRVVFKRLNLSVQNLRFWERQRSNLHWAKRSGGPHRPTLS